jgi:hypothetical protein
MFGAGLSNSFLLSSASQAGSIMRQKATVLKNLSQQGNALIARIASADYDEPR